MTFSEDRPVIGDDDRTENRRNEFRDPFSSPVSVVRLRLGQRQAIVIAMGCTDATQSFQFSRLVPYTIHYLEKCGIESRVSGSPCGEDALASV